MEILAAQKRYAEAETMAAEALAQRPDDIDLAYSHASFIELQGRRDEALALMEALLERAPDNASLLNYIGYTLADAGRDLDRSLQLLLRAVEISPDTDYMLDSLAWACYRLGDYPEAWRHIRRALSLSGEQILDATIWDHYGDIALAVGNREEARRGWQNALEMEPEDPAAIRGKLDSL
jgi:Flp pilus assembly protein TadD